MLAVLEEVQAAELASGAPGVIDITAFKGASTRKGDSTPAEAAAHAAAAAQESMEAAVNGFKIMLGVA